MPGREHNPPDGEMFSTFIISPSSSITFIIPSSLSLDRFTAYQLLKRASSYVQSLPLKQNITEPPPPLSSLPAYQSLTHLSQSLSQLQCLLSQCNSTVSVSPNLLKHTPSTLPFPESEINQCWLELSCNKSGPVLDWSLPSQPVTAWPSLRIN